MPGIPIVFVPSTDVLRLMGSGPVPGFGGADRDRTDDLKLAKLALSQLSYGPWDKTSKKRSALKWWARDELNVRPHAYQACALTT